MNSTFFKKHSGAFTFLGLLVAFYFIFFHNIGSYPLLDIDETRYVTMSREMLHNKDFLTLYLNGDFFFEKPPLYFWLESLSFVIFNQVSEFSARFPMSVDATLCCFLLYFVGQKIVSRRFGVVSALILATSAEFLVMSKIAILDMVLATCIAFSLYSGFMTFFCKEQNKKFFWWGFYLFSGLAVLAKGIPGVAIPFGSMFFAGLISKRFKEYFRPQYILPGSLIFFLTALPWHIIMFKMHDPLFFNEYIMKHHLARFINSKDLGREQPWYYFILMMLWGLVPWVASFIAMIATSVKKFSLEFLKNFNFEKLDNKGKFITLNIIYALFTLWFFSSSSTKLMTYILPIYAPCAVILAWWWCDYIWADNNKKATNISVYILNSVLIIAAIGAAIAGLFLPKEISLIIEPVKWFTVILLSVLPLVGIICAKNNKKLGVFASYVAFMLVLSAFGTHRYFNLDYSFGQNDLMKYAQYAQQNHLEIASYKFGRRFSLLYYSGKGEIKFQQEPDSIWLKSFLSKPDSIVVVQNKHLDEIKKEADFDVIQKGIKYSLIKK
ncbi:MAG: glycosyltransferase family 39 protein [Candidatus Gastranaerophilales bacterium]|nr:glycosyltransferase family 39 protein [Candidatus Gastranaerophilales bacterium]